MWVCSPVNSFERPLLSVHAASRGRGPQVSYVPSNRGWWRVWLPCRCKPEVLCSGAGARSTAPMSERCCARHTWPSDGAACHWQRRSILSKGNNSGVTWKLEVVGAFGNGESSMNVDGIMVQGGRCTSADARRVESCLPERGKDGSADSTSPNGHAE